MSNLQRIQDLNSMGPVFKILNIEPVIFLNLICSCPLVVAILLNFYAYIYAPRQKLWVQLNTLSLYAKFAPSEASAGWKQRKQVVGKQLSPVVLLLLGSK